MSDARSTATGYAIIIEDDSQQKYNQNERRMRQ